MLPVSGENARPDLEVPEVVRGLRVLATEPGRRGRAAASETKMTKHERCPSEMRPRQASDEPTHQHDCPMCIFLGNWTDPDDGTVYDLYFHPFQEWESGTTYVGTCIARYGSSGEYSSLWPQYINGDSPPELREAKRRVELQGST